MSATEDFDSSLQAVHALIDLEAKLQDPPTPDQKATSDGLRGAVVVLTLACFEGFLKTLFEEHLDRIIAADVPIAYYSEAFRVSAVYNSLEFAHKGDGGESGKRTERMPSSIGIARSIGAGWFSPRALSSTKSNPNSGTLNSMFGAVGRKDSWKSLQAAFEEKWPVPVTQAFCRDKLDALVGFRNQVAHTAVSSNIARSYLTEIAEFIRVLGEVVAEELDSHVGVCIQAAVSKRDEEREVDEE